MANQQNSTQGSYKSKTPRLFLRNLFTAGWENRDVLWPTTVQTPDGKTKPYVPKYPDTISGSFKAYRGQSKVLLKASLYFLIFIAPLLVLMLYGLSELMNAALASSYNFMGNIGIGYPGAIDSLVLAKAAKLNVYKEFMLYFYAGAVIASIGMAGLGNVARKAIWNEPFKYIAKPFFTGIKKHWWKYLLTVVVGGGIALAMAEVLLYHMVNMTLGVAGAGSWCAVIFTFVFGVPLALIAFTMLTMIPSYKLSFWQIIKNSIVMLVNNIVSVLMVVIISCVPIFLLAVSSMLSIFIYILMIAFGCSLVAMLWTGLGHSSYLKCAVLAEYLDENDKKKSATDARERKYAEKKEIRGEVVEKKPQQKQQFQNPKKKKKQ
ncbi:MAG TPA: hypothetical protein VJZ69_00500 [Clostridia bacterium]|nr:hypothetical protein [Clostridia bacterium]